MQSYQRRYAAAATAKAAAIRWSKPCELCLHTCRIMLGIFYGFEVLDYGSFMRWIWLRRMSVCSPHHQDMVSFHFRSVLMFSFISFHPKENRNTPWSNGHTTADTNCAQTNSAKRGFDVLKQKKTTLTNARGGRRFRIKKKVCESCDLIVQSCPYLVALFIS